MKASIELRYINRTSIGTKLSRLGFILQQRTRNDAGEWQSWEDVPSVTQEQAEQEDAN